MAPSFKLQDIFSVQGKVVVVTGGGTGIGKAITAGFVENGAKVYITGRRLQVLEAAAKEVGGDITCIQGDVATKEGVQKIVKEIEAKEQVVDTLINCAGVSRPWNYTTTKHNDPDAVEKLLESVIDEDFDYTNRININGVYFMTTLLIPLLRKSDNPSVVIIASIAGLANQRTMGSLTYGVSKAGAIHLATLLAGRLHPLKIRVNTICPGIFPSEMTGTGGADHKYDLGDAPGKAAARSTVGRAGRPEEIAGPVILLASKAGSYMDNALLTIDGGRLMGAGINDGLRMPEDTYVD